MSAVNTMTSVQVASPEQRLGRFWGRVDQRHNALIAAHTQGRTLDVGSGYGTLTAALDRVPGVRATGVEVSAGHVEIARRLHPEVDYLEGDARDLPFAAGEFDSIVLRDALHHVLNEGDWDAVRAELLRVAVADARFVVFEPNVQPILRAGRAIIGHDDEECTLSRARGELEAMGCRITHVSYNTLFTLPLSGGYGGAELVPPRPRLARGLLRSEEGAERLARRLGLERHLAWRYLMVGVREGTA